MECLAKRIHLGIAGSTKMLVLSRKKSERILIGSEISITVVKIEGSQVRLGIEAPPDVSILRNELAARSAYPPKGHECLTKGVRRTRSLSV